MATVSVTGTIKRADGVAAPNVSVQLAPRGRAPGTGEVQGGVGILTDPVEVLTASDGTFAITAVQGFQYQLEIPALGYLETFTAPNAVSISFDLLGLVPVLLTVKDFTDPDGLDTAIAQLMAPRISAVLERFNVIAVESAADLAGPWVEIGVVPADNYVPLVSSTDSYEVMDIAPQEFYRARYRNTVTGDDGAYSDPVMGDAFREALAMSVTEFRNVYLFGIDLVDGQGNPFPNIMYEWYIKAAAAWLEHALSIKLVAENIVDELHDHYSTDYAAWGYFQLHNYPVSRIDGVSFKYQSQTDETVIPLDWVVLEDDGAHGVIQIVPGQGVATVISGFYGANFSLLGGSMGGRVPGIWRLSYRTGFEPGDMPYDLRHLIGLQASLGVMNVAGDLVGGSGLQGWSTSLPGLTQSITTTNSSTNAGFGARVLEYQKEIGKLLPVAQAFYGKTIKLVVV